MSETERNEITQNIAEIDAAKTQILDEVNQADAVKKAAIISNLLDRIKDSGDRVPNIVQRYKQRGSVDNLRSEAKSIKDFVVQFLHLSDEGKLIFPVAQKDSSGAETTQTFPQDFPQAAKFFEIVRDQKLKDGLDNYTATLIQPTLEKIIENPAGIDSAFLKREMQRMRAAGLTSHSARTYGRVADIFKGYAQKQLGMDDESIKQNLELEDQSTQQEEDTVNSEAKQNFEDDWRGFRKSIDHGSEEYNLLRAIYIPSELKRYIKTKKDIIRERRRRQGDNNPDEAVISEEVSKDIEMTLIRTVDKIIAKLDRSKPTEMSQEALRGDNDFMANPMTLLSRLETALGKLRGHEDLQLKYTEDANDYMMRKNVQQKPVTELIAVQTPSGEVVYKPETYLKPIQPDQVSLDDYSTYLYSQVQSYKEIRILFHDISAAIYGRINPDQGGVWKQQHQLISRVDANDLDSMRYFPNYDKMMTALQIYEKLIDREFAKHDWHNEPQIFDVLSLDKNTILENEVREQMRLLYPDLAIEDIDAAISQAVGYAYLLMIPQEKAGHARGTRDPYGKPDNKSAGPGGSFDKLASVFRPFAASDEYFYYPHMAGALHLITVDDTFDDLTHGVYDHLKYMQTITTAYQNAQTKGKEAYGGKKGQTLLELEDFSGNGGGVMSRPRSWRTDEALKTLSVFKVDEDGRRVDLRSTFKATELIGYQISSDLVARLTSDPEMKAQLLAETSEKRELLEYMFEKYFHRQSEGLDGYLGTIRKQAKTEVIRAAAEERFFPANQEEVDKKIEEVALTTFFNRVNARMLTEHLPTKYLRLSQTRTSEHGKSDYVQVMEELANMPGHEHMKEIDGRVNYEKYNAVLTNMLRAEALVRGKVSKVMREEQAGTTTGRRKELYEIDLADHGVEYSLRNEVAFRRMLENELFPAIPDVTEEEEPDETKRAEKQAERTHQQAERTRNIQNTAALYRILKTRYIDNDGFLDQFADDIANNEYPYTLALEDTDLQHFSMKAGKNLFTRKFSDFSQVEEVLVPKIAELYPMLKELAVQEGDDQQKFDKIADSLKAIYDVIEGTEGTDVAITRTEQLAKAIIIYYKRDTAARGLVGFKYGKRGVNSLAAEDAGTNVDYVWEWEAKQTSDFIDTLVRKKALRKDPYDHLKPMEYVPMTLVDTVGEKIHFIPGTKVPKPNMYTSEGNIANSEKFKEAMEGDDKDVLLELLMKFGPIAIGIAAALLVYTAYEKENDVFKMKDAA